MKENRPFQSELDKMKRMTPKDLIWYLWEYYKFHAMALILAVAAVGVIGSMIYRSTFTTRLCLAVVNDRSGGTGSTQALEEELRQALGLGKKDLIEFNEGLSARFDDEAAMSEYGYASLMKISALTAGNDLDLMITDPEVIEHYEALSAFLDLEETLPADLLEAVRPALLYAKDEQGVSRAVALSLEHTSFSEKTGIVMDPPCLAVLTNTTHTEEALAAIRYLFLP